MSLRDFAQQRRAFLLEYRETPRSELTSGGSDGESRAAPRPRTAGAESGRRPDRGGGFFGFAPPPFPLLDALDSNQDGQLAQDEIDVAARVLRRPGRQRRQQIERGRNRLASEGAPAHGMKRGKRHGHQSSDSEDRHDCDLARDRGTARRGGRGEVTVDPFLGRPPTRHRSNANGAVPGTLAEVDGHRRRGPGLACVMEP